MKAPNITDAIPIGQVVKGMVEALERTDCGVSGKAKGGEGEKGAAHLFVDQFGKRGEGAEGRRESVDCRNKRVSGSDVVSRKADVKTRHDDEIHWSDPSTRNKDEQHPRPDDRPKACSVKPVHIGGKGEEERQSAAEDDEKGHGVAHAASLQSLSFAGVGRSSLTALIAACPADAAQWP